MSEILYKQLDTRFQKLDKRSTKYRFDMDKDIEWDRIAEKGRYFSDTWLRDSAIDIENLKKKPEILNYIEILFAFNMSKTFHLFETDVVNWESGISEANAITQSFKLLLEEEIKHVKVFHQYETELTKMYPDIAKSADDILDKILLDFRKKQHDKNRCETDKEYHYLLWLYILYFEEYTIWFDTSLSELNDEVQPCWKQVHHCHRLEEIQHVITDKAYIESLEISYEEKKVISERFIKDVLELFQSTHIAIYNIISEKFPNESLYSTDFLENSRFVNIVAHTSFSQTRSVAPYLEELAKKNDNINIQKKLQNKDVNMSFTDATVKILAKLIDCDVEKIDTNTSFTLLGLDSLGHLIFASELELILNTTVVNKIPYAYDTVNKLDNYFKNTKYD